MFVCNDCGLPVAIHREQPCPATAAPTPRGPFTVTVRTMRGTLVDRVTLTDPYVAAAAAHDAAPLHWVDVTGLR